MKVGDLVSYTHDEQTLGLIISFSENSVTGGVMVQWLKIDPIHVGSQNHWYVDPKHIVVVS
jgi:hypothetical protein